MLTHLTLAAALVQFSIPTFGFISCPVLGPDYPQPQCLDKDAIIQSALSNLTQRFDSAVQSQNTTWGAFPVNNVSFSTGVFWTGSNDLLFHYDHNGQQLPLTPSSKTQTDSDTIYRVGSVSKVFTVYTQLLQNGDAFWSEPVGKYVPELAQAAANTSLSSTFGLPQWNDITIGELASQQAQVGRFDFSPEPPSPALPAAVPLACPTPNCTRAQFFEDFLNYPATFLPSTTAIYSNIGYTILAWAVEGAMGGNFMTMMQKDILDPLGMSKTSLTKPDDAESVALNDSASQWAVDLGLIGPGGGVYSTVNDLARFGRSILNSTLLSAADTRRWLKPHSHTADLTFSVGAPWEIFRTTVNGRVVDLYSKSGSVEGYGSYIYLIPDYGVGFVIVAAGPENTPAVTGIGSNIFGDVMLPALEQAAQAQALANYGGTYQGSANGINATLVLDLDPALPGLRVNKFLSNGADLLQALSANYKQPISFQLQPTNIQTQTQISWRLINQLNTAAVDGGISSEACTTWAAIDSQTYNNKPLDDFIFDLGTDGKATAVTPTLLGIALNKTA